MSLIICTECGKEFSDKAPACPNCGCPTEEIIPSKNKVSTSLLEEIYTLYPDSKAYAIKEYMNRTGLSVKESKPIIDDFYASKQPEPVKFSNKYTNRFHNENLIAKEESEKATELASKTTFRCPKCDGSNIQILDGKKKLSITKGVVGGLLLGPVGAIAGGTILGKKGKLECICKSCGYRWKLK
ncbi:hypothetical protein [Anaerostipes faecalis]|uniref:hypothetical protein n=1 Tax=Anaerostipes faecalis TaxID=2738446 RepID=UPI003F06C25A